MNHSRAHIPFGNRLALAIAVYGVALVVSIILAGQGLISSGQRTLVDHWSSRLRQGLFDAVVQHATFGGVTNATAVATGCGEDAKGCWFFEGQATVAPTPRNRIEQYASAHFVALQASPGEVRQVFPDLSMEAGLLDVSPGKIVLGRQLARQFFPSLQVGDAIRIVGPVGNRDVTVSGVSSSGVPEIDNRLMLSMRDAEAIMPETYKSLGIRTAADLTAEEISSAMEARLRALQRGDSFLFVSSTDVHRPPEQFLAVLSQEAGLRAYLSAGLSILCLALVFLCCALFTASISGGLRFSVVLRGTSIFLLGLVLLVLAGSALAVLCIRRWLPFLFDLKYTAAPGLDLSVWNVIVSGWVSNAHIYIPGLVLIVLVAGLLRDTQAPQDRETITPAPISRRFLNYLADSVFIVLLQWGTLWCLSQWEIAQPLLSIVMVLEFFAYYAVAEGVFQKTIGKSLTKTRVVTLDGQQIGMHIACRRTLARVVPFYPLSLRGRTWWHDRWTNSRVVLDSAISDDMPAKPGS